MRLVGKLTVELFEPPRDNLELEPCRYGSLSVDSSFTMKARHRFSEMPFRSSRD